MADAIVRLRVESSEYDQKLSRATQQLQHMEKEVRRTGATFAVADKEDLAFVQSLGKMSTQASSAKSKLREYSDAITSLTATYRAMTDEEKKSDFGKAMAASIEQIKVKAAELKDIMSDTQREITNLASDTAFTDGLNMMTRTIGASASAIVAWTGDSKEMEAVIKDLAKIGTTVAAVDKLTKAFQKQNLVLLKNPYVAAAAAAVALAVAIGKVIKKSQELSAVEKTLQEVEQKGREGAAQEVTRIDTLNNILHDNTRSLEDRKNALKEIQSLVPDYHGALTEEGNLINDNTGAIDDYIDGLQRAATAQAAFDRMVELQKAKMEQQLKLQKAQQELSQAQAMQAAPVANGAAAFGGGGGMSVGTATSAVNNMSVKTAEAAVNSIQKVIDEQDDQIKALRDLVKSNDIGTTGGKGSTKGGAVKLAAEVVLPEGSAAKLKAQIADLQKQWSMATSQGERDTLLGQIQAAEKELDAMSPKVEEVAEVIRNAATMWTEHTDKIADTEARLAEFRAMISDTSLSEDQRKWAEGMAEVYQEQLDKMKGATEEAVSEISGKLERIPSTLDMMKSGVGAVSELGNAMGELKNIGEDLASAFSGEMDAWDSLMTVFNSGISIMQTVIGVMEAINTLTELSTALKGANAAATTTEATTEVTAAGMEVAAEGEKTAAAATATAANTAEAASGAGKSVSWIPIVGPILAVAAIAAVLGAIMSSKSQAANAGKFANGGIVPGNDYNDGMIANVSSGELILNRAQQSNIASQLQGSGAQTVHVTGMIKGSDLYLVEANYAKEQGLLVGTTQGAALKIQ